MLFGTKQRLKRKNINTKYRHHVVHTTENYKYLGVDIDQSVNLDEHLNKTYKKPSHLLKRLTWLKRLHLPSTKQWLFLFWRTDTTCN